MAQQQEQPAGTKQPIKGEKPHGEPVLDRVPELVRFLRANCPWDNAQTPRSLLPYLLEEAHELVDAVSAGNDEELASEIGDLLLNVVFQLVLAEERGAFDATTVVTRLEEKMRRRHPQLYGKGERQCWETQKAAERDDPSLVAGLSAGLDPLSRAHRLQERVSSIGFDWSDTHGAFAKVTEELEEVRQALEEQHSPALEEELGDLLFAVVNLTRRAGKHAMNALQRANHKFSLRFRALEELAATREVDLAGASLKELDELWDEIKDRDG